LGPHPWKGKELMRWPTTLVKEAELEGYIYFNKNIRPLPKKPDGSIDTMQPGFQDNDVDAFRHAYVSGIFTHEYGERIAHLLGWMNEFWSGSVEDRNMDLWNNEIGRKLAAKHKSKESLAEAVREALVDGSLIVNLSDKRIYEGAAIAKPEGEQSVIVLKESPTGANEIFFDFETSRTMDRDEFVTAITQGQYPGYAVRRFNGINFPVSKRDKSKNNNLG
jgi:hypothetical protein